MERQDWSSRNGSSQSHWGRSQHGIFEHHPHAGGNLHVLQWRHGICNNAVKFALLVRLFGSTLQGMTKSASWSLRGPNPAAWGVSTADPGFRKESAKKGVCRWREEIWDAEAGGELYSQSPLPFLRAMAGCIAIGSLATAMDWFVSFTLYISVITAWLKRLQWREKKGFSHTYSTSEILKGNRGLGFPLCTLAQRPGYTSLSTPSRAQSRSFRSFQSILCVDECGRTGTSSTFNSHMCCCTLNVREF